MTSTRRVVVTGIGLVSSLGIGTDAIRLYRVLEGPVGQEKVNVDEGRRLVEDLMSVEAGHGDSPRHYRSTRFTSSCGGRS